VQLPELTMQKVTNADVAIIVQLLQADIAKYLRTVDVNADNTVCAEQHTDIVTIYAALVQFMQNKNAVQLCDTIMHMYTDAQSKFYKTVHYCTDNYLYA